MDHSDFLVFLKKEEKNKRRITTKSNCRLSVGGTNGTLHATPRPDQLEEQIVVLRTEASKTMSTPMAQVHAHLQEALKQSRHLQNLVGGVETRPEQLHVIPAKRSVPPTASERAPSTNRQETPVHSDTPTSQQQQTRREQELSVELEQARQQIKILQQVLSR